MSFFVVPREYVKGRIEDKILVLNRIALQVISEQRGRHPEFVFAWAPVRKEEKTKRARPPQVFKPVETMNNTAWQSARMRAGLPELHVHDLRHTFATRLAAASVPPNVIAQLLSHSSKDVTEHYMGSQVLVLLTAVEGLTKAPEKEDLSLATLIAQSKRRGCRGSSK